MSEITFNLKIIINNETKLIVFINFIKINPRW